MISKPDLLRLFNKEVATTLKVMRALPEDKIDFAPHERSSAARQLMSTFVFEMYLTEMYVFGEEMDASKFKSYQPRTLQTLIEDFEAQSAHVASRLEEADEAELGKTVEFAGAKFIADEFMLLMIHDQIHHRGQLSVYVRLAGGKVPSIYGPSADDKSTNL